MSIRFVNLGINPQNSSSSFAVPAPRNPLMGVASRSENATENFFQNFDPQPQALSLSEIPLPDAQGFESTSDASTGVLVSPSPKKRKSDALTSSSNTAANTDSFLSPAKRRTVVLLASPHQSSASLSTPPKTTQAFEFSPSIQESPTVPRPVHAYHKADALFHTVKPREIKNFKGKTVHSVEINSPDRDQVLQDSNVHSYVSKGRKHFAKHHMPPPSLAATPEVEVAVLSDKEIQITKNHPTAGKKSRTYGIHEQLTSTGDKRASYYPKGGEGVIAFEKGKGTSPHKLLGLVNRYRAGTTRKPPATFVVEEHQKLVCSQPQGTV